MLATDGEYSGPYVDKIVYKVITQDDQQVLALQDDEIDLIGDMIDPVFLETLLEAENIDVANVLRNGYGYITINCDKYPFNITAFRRAFAFALDKEAISDDAWDGLSVPQDSVVSQVNPFSIEGMLPYTYYESNVALGNQLLDDAGFYDIDEDGIREAPDGSTLDVVIEVTSSSNIAIEVGSLAADALVALGIDAESVPTDFYEYLNRLYFHGDYDMVFLGASFSDFDVDWLAYEYWSEYADEPYWNFPNFRNASYDSWRDQLLHSPVYEDVFEAALEMQKIWVYQCPMVICYENVLLSAYRTDTFEGFVNDISDGVLSYWTNMEIHLKDELGGPFGGTFRISNPLDIDSFNFMASSSAYTTRILDMFYDSLIKQDPDGDDISWLAETYTIETHEDNPSVPEGHTRFTFEMNQTATWSDGSPLTAEDVATTMNFYRDAPGNPLGTDLADMTAAYAPYPYTAVIEFNSESYWYLHIIGYKHILPKALLEDIGLDGWNTWNPNPPVNHMLTSGPFNVSDYVAGEFVELVRNPYYFGDSSYAPLPNAPDVSPIEDFVISEGSSTSLTWTISDNDPDSYEILRNDIVIQSGLLNLTYETVTIDLNNYSMGVYNFTCIAYDDSGGSTAESVLVIVLDQTAPTIDHPPDVTYTEGDTGNTITWTAQDKYPSIYSIFRNDTILAQGYWTDSNPITLNVDGLTAGLYNFTIVLFDSSVNVAFDTVEVLVTDGSSTPSDTTPTTPTTPTTTNTDPFLGGDILTILSFSITIGSMVVIVVIVVLIFRAKQ
ncbi:MAG: ABC transporter substrate-binding protein [Candidatus Thorarchaeota archaeon]|nr:ABC transporter substrate-binding protein [Candidatus Thorarchaeota archaeon]